MLSLSRSRIGRVSFALLGGISVAVILLSMVFLGTFLHPSKGMAGEALSIKFEVLTPRVVVGGKATVKITVTVAAGTPYPVLAQALTAKFDGQVVLPAPQGLFDIVPLTCAPSPELQETLHCAPDKLNAMFYVIEAEKLAAFFQTHRDAVWYYTTEPLAQSRRYVLEVEVNDGSASGSGTWSIFPSMSQQRPAPLLQMPASSTLLPAQDTSLFQPRSSLVASAGSSDAFPLLAQAEGWECQAIPLRNLCDERTVTGGGGGGQVCLDWYGCVYYLSYPNPGSATQFRWTGSGPPDPMGQYGTGFERVTDGTTPGGLGVLESEVPFPRFILTGWFVICPRLNPTAAEDIARLTQSFGARFAGWSFQGCIPTTSELRLDLEVDPPLVAPSGLSLSLLATLDIPGPAPVVPASTATVTVRATHVPQGGSVTVTVRAAANPTREELTSGGHAHGENPLAPGGAPARRPKGTFSLTGEANSFHESVELHFSRDDSQTVTYQAPEVGGRERIVATALNQSAQRSVDVTVGTLESLAAIETNFWDLVGNNGALDTSICPHEGQIQHPSSFWGTHGMIEALQEKMSAFTEESYGQGRTLKLQVNDMNLERGGLFDACNNWQRPHSLHRLGKSVDFNQVTRDFLAPHTQRALNVRRLTEIMELGNVFERIYEALGELHFEYRGE